MLTRNANSICDCDFVSMIQTDELTLLIVCFICFQSKVWGSNWNKHYYLKIYSNKIWIHIWSFTWLQCDSNLAIFRGFSNNLTLYSPKLVYKELGYNGISFIHLLAFFSCCTNPITYCFMNSKFRECFLLLFGCTHSVNSDYTSAVNVSNLNYKSRSNAQTHELIWKTRF